MFPNHSDRYRAHDQDGEAGTTDCHTDDMNTQLPNPRRYPVADGHNRFRFRGETRATSGSARSRHLVLSLVPRVDRVVGTVTRDLATPGVTHRRLGAGQSPPAAWTSRPPTREDDVTDHDAALDASTGNPGIRFPEDLFVWRLTRFVTSCTIFTESFGSCTLCEVSFNRTHGKRCLRRISPQRAGFTLPRFHSRTGLRWCPPKPSPGQRG